MPTLNDVWQQALQINANLNTLHNDVNDLENIGNTTNQRLAALLQQAGETNDWLEEVRQLLNDGFGAVSAQLTGVQLRQDLANQLLLHQAEQQRTMICILEHISENTCRLLSEATRQTALQEEMAADLDGLRHMFATAHSDAALVHQRHLEERARLERCCPPDEPEPACRYAPCDAPGPARPREVERSPDFDPRPSRVSRRPVRDEIR